MRIVFAGAERTSSREALRSAGVSSYAINLNELGDPKRGLSLDGWFPDDAYVALFTSPDDDDLDRFAGFVETYEDHLAMIVTHPDYATEHDPRPWGARWWPTWTADIDQFSFLAESHGQVAVAAEAIADSNMARRVRSIAHKHGTRLMVVSSKADVLQALPWEAAIVGSWTSPQRYGETQIWDGTSLRRFPKQQKKTARRRYARQIEALGISPDAVQADDAAAVTALAIVSWMRLGASTASPATAHRASRTRPSAEPGSTDSATDALATSDDPYGTGRPQRLLPGLVEETIITPAPDIESDLVDSAEAISETRTLLRNTGITVRRCDSCSISADCPLFSQGERCALSVPVTLRSKDQFNSVMLTMLEMQGERALFARFAEQMSGDITNPEVSKEFDRFFNLAGKMSELNSSGDVLKMTVEARGGAQGGIISRLFGAAVGDKLRPEVNQTQAERAITAVAHEVVDQ